MLAALVIVFREVIEAGLIVGIVLAAARGVPGRWRMVAGGIAGGVLGACVLAAFAGLALALALVGIYGLMAWSVARRTREIGIRMALGAQTDQVVGMVIRYGMKLSALGLIAGLVGAFATRRFLASLVFDVSPADPLIYGGAALLMLGVAMLACYLPARRASRVDPLIALRWE